jgi:subtilase family serine protease
MQGLLNTITSRALPTRLSRQIVASRQLRAIAFGLLTSSLIAPSGAFGQGSVTIGLSSMITKSTILSATDPAKEISVVLSLPLGDSKGAAEFARRVSDPRDQLYRQFLTPEEFATRFGANEAD